MWGFTALFPVISALMWLGMLLGLFLNWEVHGKPHYPSMEAGQRIAYISDTGAYRLKPLFIAGSVVTTVFLDLAFLSERWLRHVGRLAPNTSMGQKVLSGISIFFAIIGTCGLILLSIFDTYRHPRLHDIFLLLFIGGYLLSAIFLCAEYQRLGIHMRQHRIIRISFWVKLSFILVEIALAAAFVATSYTHRRNIAAILEWVVALVFTLYVLSFLLDLLPSIRTSRHVPQGVREMEKKMNHAQEFEPGDSAGPNDSAGYRGTAVNGGGYNYPTGQQSNPEHDQGRNGRFY